MASQQSVDIQAVSDNALFAYDILLTLPYEITYIWHRRVRLGTVLYLLARYPALLLLIIAVYLDIANIPLEVRCVCNPLVHLADCLGIVILPGIEGLLLARVYAMSQHNQGMRRVLGALGLLLYMGSLSTGVFIAVKSECNITADTINDVFIMLFDTLVVVVTLYHTLGLVRRSREFPMLPQRFVLTITLADLITTKVLYDVQFHGTYLTFSITERVAHPNGTTPSAHHAVTSFRAAARQIHDSLMDEFGDPSIQEIGTSEAIGPHREDDPLSNAVVGIELEEIPQGRGPASAIEGDVRSEPTCGESFVVVVHAFLRLKTITIVVAASAGEVSLEV
ncbi:hypothetical protein JB92DRAFT_2949208 [Gautieria morchelliformis]|nr:hypothetical protein JB92DRAFT_2949208 [Gautieria morchelliformis]